MNIIGFFMEHPVFSITAILIIIFGFWNWYTNCKWMDEVTENQRQIIELLKKQNKDL